ncbi:fructose-6-phosphate aldolase [Pseudonocardia yuanmonensis]|uniref:Fructose-6-phosphate aldolase n=1 Tax=Pseudonocardia yuanmonensis TaxID=1095914 RepID=A0ABP8X8D4_9PSEU
MRLYLDSADRDALGPLLETGLFGGVTTNPLILHRAGIRQHEGPALVDWLVDQGCGHVFVQTTADDAAGTVQEGLELRGLSDRVVVKIPATVAGLTAARRLADDGVPVLVTAIYHARQALLANAAGARWIAPYLGRMGAARRNGREQVLTMQTLLRGTATRVLVAGIKDVQQVVDLAALDVDAFTLGTDLAEQLLQESLTEDAVAEFSCATAKPAPGSIPAVSTARGQGAATS